MSKDYNEDMIREAVDIAVGDDGFRSTEVIEILKHLENPDVYNEPDRAQSKDDYYMSLQD